MPLTWHHGKGETILRKRNPCLLRIGMEEAFNGREAWASVLGVDGTVWNAYCGGGYINLMETHRTYTPSKVYNNNF